MMKRMIHTAIGPWLKGLIVWALLLSFAAIPAVAEDADPNAYGPLKPNDLKYQLDGTTATSDENAAITLRKQAVRTGPTEWTVNVSATVKSEKVEQREVEVVFVLDASGSMAWCADEVAHTSTSHKHSNQCYGTSNLCGLDSHQHSWNNNCYSNSQCTYDTYPDHYTGSGRNRKHRTDLTCLQRYGSYYALICTTAEHSHSQTCRLKCGQVAASHSSTGAKACTYTDAQGTHNYPTRLEVAKEAVSTLVSNLPANVAEKAVYVAFSSEDYIDPDDDAIVMDSYDDLEAEGATMMMAGIDLGINQFTNNESTKILVVITDGESQDGYTSTKYQNFIKNGGVVFTVGFNHDNDNLEGMVANGGAYYQASNPGELTNAFDDISAKMTAMIEDPMSAVVGFDTDKFQETVIPNVGDISYVGDTIYWNPSTDDGNISQISYSYKVTLDAETDANASYHIVGTHLEVPLNNTTYFHYSVDGDSKDVVFPIPKATYGVSSVQTKWQYNGTDLLDPTEVEKEVGCDYKGDITNDDGTVTAYVPAFKQKYDVLTPTIQNDGMTYIYDSTTVTVTKPDGAVETYTYTNPADVDTVIASNPDAHVVVHNYLKAGQLVIDGTKVLEGREFEAGDAFTFKLNATDGAPLPSPSTVTITPTAGSSEIFRFPPITYNTVGTYTYTLQELLPEESARLERMDYDTEPRTVVVTVTRNSSGVLNASYTVDGQALPAVFTNRYALGNLLVSKTVGGNMGSRNSEFDFTVTLPDMAGQTVSCTLDGSPLPLTLDDQGHATFTLRHDQTLVMSAVHGAYTVEEARFGSYVTNISVNDGDSVQTNSVSGTLGAGDTHAAFLNTLNAEVPTGIATSTGAAIAGLMLSTALLAISRAGRRRRDAQ